MNSEEDSLQMYARQFGLINMNGRVYDPVLGRMLSPDNYVQSPTSTQSYNRYSYVLNNPLKYTDPTGEFWHIVIGAAVGGIINLAVKAYQGKIDSWQDGLVAFGIGAVAGAVGAATGGAAFAAAGGAAGGAGGFGAGAVSGMTGSAFSTAIENVGNAAYFGDPIMSADQYLTSVALGGVLGGTTNGIIAVKNGRGFWNGDMPRTNITPIQPIKPSPISSGTKHKKQIRSNVKGDYDLMKREWQNVLDNYGNPPTKGQFPNQKFEVVMGDKTTVIGKVNYGGNTNPNGYTIKIKTITPKNLQIDKQPSIHIRYNNEFKH